MKDDLLERATRAARDEYATGAEAGELGRRRLERALASSPPLRGRRRLQALVLVAASFAGLSAWASVTGRLPRFLRGQDAVVAPSATGAASASASAAQPGNGPHGGNGAAVLAPTASAVEPEPVPALSADPVPPPVLMPKSAAPRTVPSVPRTVASAPTAPATSVDVDALYREAYEAHFVRKDPNAALVAWDRYLAAAGPSGRMTVEARYNRALSLVRLGRKDEARAALEPFARGEYGGYRREDAQRLITSLQ